jgi:hypothetical protein
MLSPPQQERSPILVMRSALPEFPSITRISWLDPVAGKLGTAVGRLVNVGATSGHVEAADVAGRHVEFGKALVIRLEFNGERWGGQDEKGKRGGGKAEHGENPL